PCPRRPSSGLAKLRVSVKAVFLPDAPGFLISFQRAGWLHPGNRQPLHWAIGNNLNPVVGKVTVAVPVELAELIRRVREPSVTPVIIVVALDVRPAPHQLILKGTNQG